MPELQFVVNGLILGLRLAVLGCAFSLLYRTSRFLDFGFGAAVMMGAYVAYWLTERSVSLLVSAVVAILTVGAFGYCLHRFLFRFTDESHGGNGMIQLMSSLGVFIASTNLVILAYSAKNLRYFAAESSSTFIISTLRLSHERVVSAILMFSLLMLVAVIMMASRWGMRISAVGEDFELAQVFGIPAYPVSFMIAMVAYGIAAGVGVLEGWEASIRPGMGFQALLWGVVVAMAGGKGRWNGAIIAGLLIGVFYSCIAYWIGSSWQPVALFLLLITIIFFRRVAAGLSEGRGWDGVS